MKYGCHVDLEEGQEPDNCVLDGGDVEHCFYAKTYGENARQKCKEWKPIKFQKQEPTGIEAMVCQDIADRQALGIQKYKTTLADNPLELKEWLEHQYLELLDAALYCKRAIVQIETTKESKHE